MGDGIAGLGLLKAPLDLREEIESLHRVFDRRVFRKILNGSNDLTLCLWCFHKWMFLSLQHISLNQVSDFVQSSAPEGRRARCNSYLHITGSFCR